MSPLYIITAFANPCGWHTRGTLFRSFEEMVGGQYAALYAAEMAYGDRAHEVTSRSRVPMAYGSVAGLQFRSNSILWHKENLLNLALAQLPSDAKYVAWIDADVSFIRPDWAAATVTALRKYPVVQMWSHAVDYGPDFQPLSTCRSLMASYLNVGGIGLPVAPVSRDMHTGYAWAARREWLDKVKFGDAAIVGGGDRHMAHAMLGQVERSFTPAMSIPYQAYWRAWQLGALVASRDAGSYAGCVPGTINHYWHGAKQDRGYQTRSNILAKHAFDPYTDLTYTTEGVLEFTEHGKRMQDDILAYFQSRNEDSAEVVNPFIPRAPLTIQIPEGGSIIARMAAPGIFAGEVVVR